MASNTISILITAKDQASKLLRGLSTEVDNNTKSSGRFKDAMVSAGKVGAAALAAGAAVATTGLIAASKAAFDQVKSVEEARFGLQAYEKDAGKVNDVLSGLVKYARSDMGVLFNRKDMFAAASTLKMYGNETGTLVDRVKILSKGVSQGKTTFQELSAIVGRAAAKGRLDAVDFDMLIERGIGLDREFRGAAVGADELWQALNNALPDELLANRAQTIEGRFIRLQSAFREVGNAVLGVDADTNEFIKGGLGDRFMKAVEGATGRLKELGPVVQSAVGEALTWLDRLNGAIELVATGNFNAKLFGGIEEDSKIVDFLLRLRESLVNGVIPALAEFGRNAFDFLAPKLQKLGSAIATDLWPALQGLWREIGPVLIPALGLLAKAFGVGLVASIGLATDILKLSVQAWSWTIGVITGSIGFLKTAFQVVVDFFVNSWNSVTTFFGSIPGAFSSTMAAVGLAVSNGVNAVATFFAELPGKILFSIGWIAGRLYQFATADVPNFVNGAMVWFQQLPGRVGSELSRMLQAVGSYLSQTRSNMVDGASSAVNGVVGWFQQLPGRAGSAIAGLWGAAVGAFHTFTGNARSWAADAVSQIVAAFADLPGRISSAISGALSSAMGKAREMASNITSTISDGFNAGSKPRTNAVGTGYSPGGMTLVGEHGPELVNLPQGARVTPNYQTRQMMQNEGPSTISIQFLGPVSMRSDSDVRDLAQQIDKQQRLAARGVA